MALKADLVARRAQLERVRVVAVAAGHALLVHLALLEGCVVVHLGFHLAVAPEQALVQQGGDVGVHQGLARRARVADLAAVAVALGADGHFAALCCWRCAAGGIAGGVERPLHLMAFIQLQ